MAVLGHENWYKYWGGLIVVHSLKKNTQAITFNLSWFEYLIRLRDMYISAIYLDIQINYNIVGILLLV